MSPSSSSNSSNDQISEAVFLLKRAQSVVFLTGAGVSKESGIATFREAQTGLWAKYDPEELATPYAFRKNPKLVWQWYDERRSKLNSIKPNPGHYAMAELESLISKVVILTQNVDGLHKIAGSSDVVELHGNIREFFCFDNKHPSENVPLGLTEPPVCACGSLIRPAVVWFHESLSAEALARAQREAGQADVFIVAGTSSLVQPSAGLPLIAWRRKIPVIELNPEPTPVSEIATIRLRGASGEILPQILDLLKMKSS